MKILFIGDIFGAPGRRMVKTHLRSLIQQFQCDFVIANAENAAHGKGMTPKIYHQLMSAGVNFFTMGNHTWDKREVLSLLSEKNNIIRPGNLNEHFIHHNVGVGSVQLVVNHKTIRITNLMGQTINFSNHKTKQTYLINPFLYFQAFLSEIAPPDIHIVDFHAEMTSEKNAFFQAFQGQVSAIFGTHTHVPTNDYQVVNNTAYISDVGMSGPMQGIIGGKKAPILDVFFQRATKFKLDVETGPAQLNAVFLNIDDATNQIISFHPICVCEQPLAAPPVRIAVSDQS